MNCFQILYIRSLNTISLEKWCRSDFVVNCFQILYIRSLNTIEFKVFTTLGTVVNCFQILYIRSLNTIAVDGLDVGPCCELLSDFVYSFFEHNNRGHRGNRPAVVNCFQILYIRSLNTIPVKVSAKSFQL